MGTRHRQRRCRKFAGWRRPLSRSLWSATHPHPTTGRTDALAQRFHRCGGQSGLRACCGLQQRRASRRLTLLNRSSNPHRAEK
jgi:hypothetical protein